MDHLDLRGNDRKKIKVFPASREDLLSWLVFRFALAFDQTFLLKHLTLCATKL